MSEDNTAWFHCGRCGALFQSKIGHLEKRLCTACGLSPSFGVDRSRALPEAPAAAVVLPEGTSSGSHRRRGKYELQGKVPKYFMVKMIGIWFTVVSLLVLGIKLFWSQDLLMSENAEYSEREARKQFRADQEDLGYIQKAFPQARATFVQYLAAGTPEAKNQFVTSPLDTIQKMTRFYAMNPLEYLPPNTLRYRGSAVLHFPEGRALECVWTNDSGDRQFDSVFFEQDGRWLLDWDQFVRYSDTPFAMFLAGGGVSEGEFRVLVRERLAAQNSSSADISVVLYAPRFGSPRDISSPSPEFVLKRDSESGRLLTAAFEMQRNGQHPFGSQIGEIDPPEMIRARVKMRRIDDNRMKEFVLDQVLACHWINNGYTGVEGMIVPLPQEHPEAVESFSD